MIRAQPGGGTDVQPSGTDDRPPVTGPGSLLARRWLTGSLGLDRPAKGGADAPDKFVYSESTDADDDSLRY